MICVTVDDVQARMNRELTQEERATCAVLLDDAQAMIDAAAPGVDRRLYHPCRRQPGKHERPWLLADLDHAGR